MNDKSALNFLWKYAQQQEYKNTKSYTCIKEFTISYPKQDVKQFIEKTSLPAYSSKMK